MTDIEVEWHIKNIGPHTDLKNHYNGGSLKIGVYANNGLGKTFISRAYRLATNYNIKTINNILTSNETTGKFVFKIKNQEDPIKPSRVLSIDLKKDFEPKINNETGYLFHVFNSDYVEENLASYNYNPKGDIEGFILGKKNIDVTKEKEKMEELIKRRRVHNDKLETVVLLAKNDLEDVGIKKNLTEYKNITLKNLLGDINVTEKESYDLLKAEYLNLESMPDGLKDVSKINFDLRNSVLIKVGNLLHKSFAKSDLPKDFKEDVKSKINFVEIGIDLLHADDQNCPFCKQNLNKSANKIIDFYNQYLQDSETQTVKKIDKLIKELKLLQSDIQNYYNEFNKIFIDFELVKKYLPSSENYILSSFNDNESVFNYINELVEMLTIKKADITSTEFDFDKQIKSVRDFLDSLEDDSRSANRKIEILNKVKNSIDKEKRHMRRRLCNAKFLAIKDEQKEKIHESLDLDSKISNLDKNIKEKENQFKIPRKQKVIESINYFLEYFFDKKYEFDEKKFCIKFMDESLFDNATHVLSEGEKGIIAFCYYLATVHTIIETEEDYKRLFFVIDDPISSLDYNFVYRVAHSIRKINKHFDLKSYDRFIILTHNLEFMNLLLRNNIIDQKFILEKNNIVKWDRRLILPYQSHLLDIINISKGDLDPSHTTPNSIRHVLETICKFEHLDKNLEKYVTENEKLNDNSYIYSLIQDLSHGGLRSQPPITQQDITEACKVVIKFISEKYKGQIEALSS